VRTRLTTIRTAGEEHERAARINREIGIGAEQAIGGVTIIMQTNIDPARPLVVLTLPATREGPLRHFGPRRQRPRQR
jgi:hypothetical protein